MRLNLKSHNPSNTSRIVVIYIFINRIVYIVRLFLHDAQRAATMKMLPISGTAFYPPATTTQAS